MNYYEVTVADTRTKTLLVRADSTEEASDLAVDSVIDGDIEMDDSESDVEAIDVRPATDRCYELNLFGERCDAIECGDDIGVDDEDCDHIFECERCPERDRCSNETKFEHLRDMLIDEFKSRMEIVYATYGN